jgi:hypothetical protein
MKLTALVTSFLKQYTVHIKTYAVYERVQVFLVSVKDAVGNISLVVKVSHR